jgi:hypothetical protein
MNVSSPVGDFPFTTERVSIEEGHLLIRGRMGAWPTAIEMEAQDLAQACRLFAKPLLAIGAATALAICVSFVRAKARRGR